MYSPELQSKLQLLRAKVADNTITDDEVKEAAVLLRQERRAAQENSAKRRVRAKEMTKSGEDLLAELERS